MSTLMMAAECAAKCPPHAIAALVGTLAVGFIAGRLSARKGHCNCKRQQATGAKPVRREPRASETRAPIPAGSVEIYVGNLSYKETETNKTNITDKRVFILLLKILLSIIRIKNFNNITRLF